MNKLKEKLSANHPTHQKGTFFQAKLTVNRPGDRYEQEADAMAEKIVRGESFFGLSGPISTVNLQKKCTECEQNEQIQMKAYSNGGSARKDVEHGVLSEKANGKTLNPETRNWMESRFGTDFGNVKIHDGNNAQQLNDKLNARAFTHRDHIFFNSGEYEPNTLKGKKLLAHELTHVVQQGAAPMNEIQRDDNKTPSPDAEKESEFEFDYNLLPPSLQFSLGQWMLEANTSRVALQFTQGLMQTRFGYNYGGNLTLGTKTPSMSTELGFNPHSPALSFGYSRDQFRFGANADLTGGGFGFNLGYGSRLLPMPFDLAGPVNQGWAGARGILGDLGSMQDPLSFYQSHGDNVDDIMGAVKALQPLADEENQGFGVGLRFTYNPQTGVLIHAGAQWIF